MLMKEENGQNVAAPHLTCPSYMARPELMVAQPEQAGSTQSSKKQHVTCRFCLYILFCVGSFMLSISYVSLINTHCNHHL